MASTNVNVIVSATDKASSVLKGVAKSAADTNKNQALSFGKLAGAIGVGSIAANLFSNAIAQVGTQFKASLDASVKFQNSMMGLESIARAFGQDVNAATSAAQSLAEDGLMSVAEAAGGLKNLLASGFSLDQAIVLMNRFKDSAAFGRQGALGFGEAIVGATEGIKNGNSILVDNAGVTKNLSVILEEAGFSAQDLMNATSDASVRQAIFNGILKETNPMLGDATKLSSSFGGQMARTGTAVFNLQSAIGQALQPAVSLLAESFGSVLNDALEWVQANMSGIKAWTTAIAGGFITLAQVVIGVAKVIVNAIQQILTFGKQGDVVGAIKETWVGAYTTVKTTQQRITDATTQASSKQVDVVKGGIGKMTDAHNKKTQKMKEDLEEETRKYKEENEKRERNFKERLQDLIFAHIDKRDSLKKDIQEENDDFAESMEDRVQDQKDKLADMEKDHQEKVDEIKAQIEEETAKGAEANQKTIADLQARLAKEDTEYAAKKAKEEQRFAEDQARLQKDHDERVAKYQEELKKEEDILNKHKDDVAAMKDTQREDDITRLKRQYEEEKAEADKEHQRKMADLKKQGSAEGSQYGGALNDALTPQLETLKESMKNAGSEGGKQFADEIKRQAEEAGRNLVRSFMQGIVDNATRAFNLVRKYGIDTGFFGPIAQISSQGAKLMGFETGGVVPGAIGEPVLAKVHGGEVIQNPARAGASSNGNNVELHVHVGLYAGSETEKRNIARELYNSLVTIARAQNKSVAEMLGG